MLRRSILTSAVVGTILVAINQGTVIVAGEATTELAWKIPLTYCVPFLVASWGALGNAYTRADRSTSSVARLTRVRLPRVYALDIISC